MIPGGQRCFMTFLSSEYAKVPLLCGSDWFYLTTQPADCFQPRVLESRTETQDLSSNINRHRSRLDSHRPKKQRNTVEVKQDTSIPNPDEIVYLEAIWQPRQNAKTSVNKSTPKAYQRLSQHSNDWEMRLSYVIYKSLKAKHCRNITFVLSFSDLLPACCNCSFFLEWLLSGH